MPVELSELLANERWVEVEWGKVKFNVAYRPGSTSMMRQAEMQKKMRELQSRDDLDEVAQVKEMGETFCTMVCNWDLVEQGKPIPVTPEDVTNKLSMPIINTIVLAINGDMDSQQEEKKALSATSGAGSSPKGKRASAPNGTGPSAPRVTWA